MSLLLCPRCRRTITGFSKACPACGCPSSAWRLYAARIPVQYSRRFLMGTWGGAAIEWRVLDAMKRTVLVVCEQGIDVQPFNDDRRKGNAWSSCDLGGWLDDEFVPAAFGKPERAIIAEVTCLSATEADRYFLNQKDRICMATGLATHFGMFQEGEPCDWWLRSRGTGDAMFAAFVRPDGSINKRGGNVAALRAVRPALRLHL